MHRRLLALAHDSRSALILTILSGFLAGLLTMGQAYALSKTVNGVHLQGQTLSQVFPWLQLILILIAGRAALTWVKRGPAMAARRRK